MTQGKKAGRTLRGDERGAVLAEFVIAIVPLLTAFFAFVQLAHMAAARLMIKHGAIVATRAAAVFSNVHDNNPGHDGDATSIATQGAVVAMAEWVARGNFTGVTAIVQDDSSRDDPYGLVTVTLMAEYHCTVPAVRVFCRSKTMIERYSMPHQGAKYKVR